MSITNNKVQDLQGNNAQTLDEFRTYWSNGQYSQALALLSDSSLATQEIVADILNSLNSNLTYLQGLNDTTFKQNKIKTSTTPPTLSNEEVWFEIIT